MWEFEVTPDMTHQTQKNWSADLFDCYFVFFNYVQSHPALFEVRWDSYDNDFISTLVSKKVYLTH